MLSGKSVNWEESGTCHSAFLLPKGFSRHFLLDEDDNNNDDNDNHDDDDNADEDNGDDNYATQSFQSPILTLTFLLFLFDVNTQTYWLMKIFISSLAMIKCCDVRLLKIWCTFEPSLNFQFYNINRRICPNQN